MGCEASVLARLPNGGNSFPAGLEATMISTVLVCQACRPSMDPRMVADPGLARSGRGFVSDYNLIRLGRFFDVVHRQRRAE